MFYRESMRIRRVVGVTATLVVGLLLAACSTSGPSLPPAPSPSVTAVFASDEEALAAAKDAFGTYLAMSDKIAADGGKDPQRIAPLVTESQLPDQVASFEYYTTNKFHIAGSSSIASARLQQYADVKSIAQLTVYACVDIANVRILDQVGRDVTPAGRQDVVPLQVSFESSTGDRSHLLVSKSSRWSGQDFC